jgi:hypothetical protein
VLNCARQAMLSLGSGCGGLLCGSGPFLPGVPWQQQNCLVCTASKTTLSFFSAWLDYCWPLEESTGLLYFFP